MALTARSSRTAPRTTAVLVAALSAAVHECPDGEVPEYVDDVYP